MKNSIIKTIIHDKFFYIIAIIFIILILFRIVPLLLDQNYLMMQKYKVHMNSHPISLSEFKIKDNDGNIIQLNKFHGKVTVLFFWATWCRYCMIDFPYMAQMSDLIQKQKLPINIIPIAEPTAIYRDVRNFYRRAQLKESDLQTYFSFGEFLHYSVRIKGYPFFLVLDEDVRMIANFYPDFRNLQHTIEMLMHFRKGQLNQ